MSGADQLLLANRLRAACKPVTDAAKLSSSRWSRRVPASVRLGGGAAHVQIVAGGQRAPQAYTMEGTATGLPIAHPVYGHGPRKRGTLVTGPHGGGQHYVPPGWTWVKQQPRPFLREAIDANLDLMVSRFADVVDDWARQAGYK
jgi:hypothetical protein